MRIKTSIQALIRLMDDSDEMVVDHAFHTLLDYGPGIIFELEQLEEESFDNPTQIENISKILGKLRLQRVKSSLIEWLDSDNKDLIQAVYSICTYQFPNLDFDEFNLEIQQLKDRCWKSINPRQTSFEKVNALNSVFFDDFNFIKIEGTSSSPFGILVNSVLETKEGTDLSIGLIYSIVAQSLGLPIYGVTTMNNRAPFVLAYLDKNNLLPILNWGIDNNGVLFYIGIGIKGLVIDPQHLKETYHSRGLPQNKSQFAPSPNSMVIKKYLNDIKRSYENHTYYRYKLQDIEELLELF